MSVAACRLWRTEVKWCMPLASRFHCAALAALALVVDLRWTFLWKMREAEGGEGRGAGLTKNRQQQQKWDNILPLPCFRLCRAVFVRRSRKSMLASCSEW